MLTQIAIRNLLLIDQITKDVPEGLLVLTGETGAGKSILMDSIGLGLGERSEACLVRQGAEQASVALTFELPEEHESWSYLAELGLEAEPGEPLILRRIVNHDGRSKAYINDQPVAIAALRRLGGLLVDIHGQFETHGLLNHENHRGYLDDYAGLSAALAALRTVFSEWKAAQAELNAARAALAALQTQSDSLQYSIAELEKLAPQSGEAETLAEKRTRLQQKGKIIEALQSASDALQGENGAVSRMASGRRILLRAAEKTGDLLNDTLDPLARAEDALNEALVSLDSLMASDEYESGALEAIEDRLFALRAAARKYQVPVEDLFQLKESLKGQLGALSLSQETLARLESGHERLAADYRKQADALHVARQKAAARLEKAMQAELAPLKLEKARLSIQVEKLDMTEAAAHGFSRVTFTGSTNPDMPAGPLHKIASGGELARFMLALRLCLAETAPTTTLIFDEVDTGIGGATADAVGERLARLGQSMQTLVITHSPQVAARGATHWRVEKTHRQGATSTAVIRLDPSQRREEIARMLAGSAVTDAARQAAESLLAGSPPERTAKKRKAT